MLLARVGHSRGWRFSNNAWDGQSGQGVLPGTRGLPRGSWFEQQGGTNSRAKFRFPKYKLRASQCAAIVAASGRTCVNVWGMVFKARCSRHGVQGTVFKARCSRHGIGPLYHIEGVLTPQHYCSERFDKSPHLSPRCSAFPDAHFVLQHDLAPVHHAKILKEHPETRSQSALLAVRRPEHLRN